MPGKQKGESGQIIIIIAVVIVILLGITALVIDVGMVFVDRRLAQSAADSAALAGAVTKCLNGDGLVAAKQSAMNNGFQTEGDTVVSIHTPPTSGKYANDAQNFYYEVIITTKSKDFFAHLFSTNPMMNTVTSVAHCAKPTGGATASLGDISILALNHTAGKAVSNSGSSLIQVDGGIYVNSNAANAYYQNGSAATEMSWVMVRGGADLSGSFGINTGLTNHGTSQSITIGGNLITSGSGKAVTGPFHIGGNLENTASVTLTGGPMEVGGYLCNSGSGTINASPLYVTGGVTNGGSGVISGSPMIIGGDVTETGSAILNGPVSIKGAITLSGSGSIRNGTVNQESPTYKCSGGGGIEKNGSISCSNKPNPMNVTKPGVTVSVPVMDDPFASVLNAPSGPSGNCTTITASSSQTQTLAMTSGGYYCDLSIGGSGKITIPPGTYWVNSFSAAGSSVVTMDSVNLYITGINTSKPAKTIDPAFKVGGSARVSMIGTMIYIKAGGFDASGSSGMTKWSGPTSGDFKGLALFMDRGNAATVNQNGSSELKAQSGTWYAPASACTFNGSTSTIIYSQFICDTVSVVGSSTLKIKYDSTLVYDPGSSPMVSLME